MVKVLVFIYRILINSCLSKFSSANKEQFQISLVYFTCKYLYWFKMVNERHMRLIFSQDFGHRVQENTDRASKLLWKND